MQDPRHPRAGAREPTPFPGLNAVLDHFLEQAREILGDTVVGAAVSIP
jgi:hypothetical protein